jgi:UDP-N-acetyl-D-glucosamine dehydrogenase
MSGLKDKIESGDARLAVIGMGYVGLPLAVEFARGGVDTTGIDVSAEKVSQINAGQVLHRRCSPPRCGVPRSVSR